MTADQPVPSSGERPVAALPCRPGGSRRRSGIHPLLPFVGLSQTPPRGNTEPPRSRLIGLSLTQISSALTPLCVPIMPSERSADGDRRAK